MILGGILLYHNLHFVLCRHGSCTSNKGWWTSSTRPCSTHPTRRRRRCAWSKWRCCAHSRWRPCGLPCRAWSPCWLETRKLRSPKSRSRGCVSSRMGRPPARPCAQTPPRTTPTAERPANAPTRTGRSRASRVATRPATLATWSPDE